MKNTAGHTHSTGAHPENVKVNIDVKKDISSVIAFAIAGIVLAVPALIAFQILMLLIDGFLFSTMWGWWVVPTFGLKPLTLVQAMAISIIIAYFRNFHYLTSETEFRQKNMAKTLLNGFITDLLYFGISWLLLIWR